MERLDKLINILKLTPHHQPELVKEATHRVLTRSFRYDNRIKYYLKYVLEILLKYCDSDDGAQRSLFNDYLNTVILAFQYQCYQTILHVLIEEVNNNGSARIVSAALARIPQLIINVQPVELGYDAIKLLKSLIEIARRAEDESVQKSLQSTLDQVMPYLDYHIRLNKEALFLANTLVEVLFRNLNSLSRRNAVSSLKTIYTFSHAHRAIIISKLADQLDSIPHYGTGIEVDPAKLSGFCLATIELPEFAEKYSKTILSLLLSHITSRITDSTVALSALEAARETLQRVGVDEHLINGELVASLVDKFLVFKDDRGRYAIRTEIKVILQANTLALITAIVKQQPSILHSNSHGTPKTETSVMDDMKLIDKVLMFKEHNDVAVRNQVFYLLGNYMAACWRFPQQTEHSLNCERMRDLWCEFRNALSDDETHPDVMKSCIISMGLCINTVLNSDHCMHILEYSDLERLVHLYKRSNFKPFKVEVLSFFSKLDYLTLSYLELYHWSYYRSKKASSFAECLQTRIILDVMIASLADESQMIRTAASTAILTITPVLYIMSDPHRSCDPIVSLSRDLAGQNSIIFEQVNSQMNFVGDNISTTNLRPNEDMVIRCESKILSSSILREKSTDERCSIPTHGKRIVSASLRRMVHHLRSALDNSLDKGKPVVLSIVMTLLKLSKAYPIHLYPSSWDCRPSEHCECFILLNFLLTYLENLTEPDVVIEDLEAYQTFLALTSQLLYALCHESVYYEYENQRMKPHYKKSHNARESAWLSLRIKYAPIANILEIYYTHLVKLLWLVAYVIEEKNNPFAMTSKSHQNQVAQQNNPSPNHTSLISNRLFFGRIHKKLESSYKSSKKNLKKRESRFNSILETCLSGLASLSEFMGTNSSKDFLKELLAYLKVTSTVSNVSSLICARQLLKSLFGINIISLYQVEPLDWFEEENASNQQLVDENSSGQEDQNPSLHGVYHHLVSNSYKIFSGYLSDNCSKLTPGSDRALAALDFESRRAMRVRYRIEEVVKSLFEFHPNQIVSVRVKEISEFLKSSIAEFTPIVMESMKQFNNSGFCHYQAEVLHFMSYLLLLRVNYQKLQLADDFINSIHKLLDRCGEKQFLAREENIEVLLRNSFTFLSLLTYERGPSKPMFHIATLIHKLDDIRASLCTVSPEERDVAIYVVPLLRCLVEDLFIYRTEHYHGIYKGDGLSNNREKLDKSHLDTCDQLGAEKETVVQKLLDVIDKPAAYDLLSILILESRLNSDGTKYEKLSQRLYAILPGILSDRRLNLTEFRRLELTKRILENISTEVFKPLTFFMETLFDTPIPPRQVDSREFQQWMSLIIIDIHILTTQVKEDKFLTRISETMTEKSFVKFLFQIVQLCSAEIFLSHTKPNQNSFLVQQLAFYMHYITYMFQSGLFFQLSRIAPEVLTTEDKSSTTLSKNFKDLCEWARNSDNGFSVLACETIFFYLRYSNPDLTIMWCNLMMILNKVDCNSDFWCNLLIYDCYHCRASCCSSQDCSLVINSGDNKMETKRGRHVNRPSSLNLLDISFNDQLRRSFIKKIAASESRPKTYEKNPVDSKVEDEEFERFGQCLAPNVELSRRGALCLVLDYVSISMNDVEHVTWLIIHHINDIIRWSHEMPIAEFINAVHGNSASSGIFIQAIDTNVNDLTSFSFVTRLLWSLEKVHYTQYGSLVVLLVEKILSSREIMPYRALTKSVEKFAAEAVQRLLHDTNKSFVTTNEEIINQLTSEDLDRIISMLDSDLYPELTRLLIELRNSSHETLTTPTISFCRISDDSDEEPEDKDEIELLYLKANLINWLSEEGYTAHMSTLLPAINTLKTLLSRTDVVERANRDNTLVAFLIHSIYSLVLTVLPPPTRLLRPRIWSNQDQGENRSIGLEGSKKDFGFDNLNSINKPVMPLGSRRPTVKTAINKKPILAKRTGRSKSELIEEARSACLECLFLFDSMDCLKIEQFAYVNELIVLLARLPLVNSFILTPPDLWKRNVWPTCFDAEDEYKTTFPLVPQEILSKDYGLLKDFCDRQLKLGWINRRQFEEAWMTLLGVLFSSISQPDLGSGNIDMCKLVITSLTRFLILANKSKANDSIELNGKSDRILEEASEGVDIESCVRLLLTVFKQRLGFPHSNPDEAVPPSSQLPPPLVTSIILSILSLSDMFTDNEQFNWLFECFTHLYTIAERNEDEIQMRYLGVGLGKVRDRLSNAKSLPSES